MNAALTTLSYSALIFGGATLWFFVNGWLLYFYSQSEHGLAFVPLAAFGAAMAISRGADLVLDLPIGYASDNTRSRWGRRLPYMLVSCLALPVVFLLMWRQLDPAQPITNWIYLTLISLLFNGVYALLEIPHTSLLPELADTEQGRLQLSTWRNGFQLAGVILAGLAGWVIGWAGYQQAALIYVIGLAPVLLLPFLVLREKSARETAIERRLGLRESLRLTFSNKPFRTLILAWSIYWGVSIWVLGLIPFIVTEICRATAAEAPYFFVPNVIVALICYPVISRLAELYGKWRVLILSLLAAAILAPGLALISDSWPIPLLAQGIVWIILLSAAMVGGQILPLTIIADATDADERVTGQRREGSFYSAQGLFGQIASMGAAAVLPLLLSVGSGPTATVGPMGVRLTGLVSGLALLIACAILWAGRPVNERGIRQ